VTDVIDPITVEVIGNHFEFLTEEMGITLVKSSYSTNIKERRDCCAVLLDAEGRTIALTAYTGGHLGSVLGLMDELFKRYPRESTRPGDVFMANDAHTGGPTHLPDITVVAPYFHEGELVASVRRSVITPRSAVASVPQSTSGAKVCGSRQSRCSAEASCARTCSS